MDSDSDDSLLNLQVFSTKRRKRTEERRIQKGFDLMDEALDHADRIADNHDRILQIKQEHYGSDNGEDDDDHHLEASLARTEQTVADAKAAAKVKQEDHHGGVPDDEQLLTRERREQLGQCMFSEVNNGLGLRRTILTSANNTSSFATNDGTLEQHKKELTTMLSSLVSPINKPLQVAWIQPMRKVKAKTPELVTFLRSHQLAKLRQVNELNSIPEQVLVWIFRVACSSCSNDDQTIRNPKKTSLLPALRNAAWTALSGLMKQHQQMTWRMQEHNDDNDQSIQPLSFLHLSQMEDQLQSWVQFTSMTTAGADSSAENGGAAATKKDQREAECRARGLQRWLDIWNKAFRYDLVTCNSDDWKEVATRCLVLLSKVGLDGCTFSSQR